MRKYFIYTAAALSAIFLTSCTQRLKLREDIDVTSGTVSLVGASVQTLVLSDADGNVIPGAEDYVWNDGSALGIYDSAGNCNIKYNLRKAYAGKTGKALFYGKEVSPSLRATLGYYDDVFTDIAEGGIPFMNVQPYCTDPYAQMREGNIFIAETDADDFEFTCRTGLLRLDCALCLSGTVKDVRFSGGDVSATVRGVNSPCSPDDPLVLYVVLMPGVYDNCMASFTMTDGRVVSKPVEGQVSITVSRMSQASVSAKNYEYGNEDFTGVDMDFDEL